MYVRADSARVNKLDLNVEKRHRCSEKIVKILYICIYSAGVHKCIQSDTFNSDVENY